MKAAGLFFGALIAANLIGAAPAARAMSVSLDSPSNGAVFIAPTNVALSATATADFNYTITKVDFFYGTTLIGTATTSPYSITWTNPSPASYALTAVATEVKNSTTQTATSSVVNIIVDARPVVHITTPPDLVTRVTIPPPDVAFTATATDSDGTIAKVDFYGCGGNLYTTVTTPPYSFVYPSQPPPYWTVSTAGHVLYSSYPFYAVATDNLGVQSTLPQWCTTVLVVPTVILTAPANGASFAAGATIDLSTALSPTDAPLEKMQFYSGTTLLGESLSAPYTFSWQNVPAGTYQLIARGVWQKGEEHQDSSPVAITVDAPPAVTLDAPAPGTVYKAPANIGLSATATDTLGTITKVDFYQGTTLIGTAATAPYTFNWTNVPAGSYSLTAVATNDGGGTTTSAAVSVIVAAPPLVFGETPKDVTLPGGSMPEIGASYSGLGSGIDVGKVVLQFDGQDVTSQSAIGAGGILYEVARGLPDATHTVSLSVTDLVGDVTTDTWTFVTSDPAPNFYGETPRDAFVAVRNPRIRVLLSGFNIVASSVSISLDGADVTSQADVGVDHIVFTPGTALGDGVHTVDVSATDANGAVGTKEWQFTVDIPPPPSTTSDGVRTDRTVVPQIRVLQ